MRFGDQLQVGDGLNMRDISLTLLMDLPVLITRFAAMPAVKVQQTGHKRCHVVTW